jgi:hypothetical protein
MAMSANSKYRLKGIEGREQGAPNRLNYPTSSGSDFVRRHEM